MPSVVESSGIAYSMYCALALMHGLLSALTYLRNNTSFVSNMSINNDHDKGRISFRPEFPDPFFALGSTSVAARSSVVLIRPGGPHRSAARPPFFPVLLSRA